MIKKLIVCIILIATILFTFCSCYPSTIDEQGVEREVRYGAFVVIEKYGDGETLTVYHKITKVVYNLQTGGYNGFLSPYLIYQDGYIYGAIFENGQIIPVPYAFAPLN